MSSAVSPCPVCDGDRFSVVAPNQISDVSQVSFGYTFGPEQSRTFQVVRCSSCTHVYCSPVPGDMTDHYRDVVDEEYLKHASSRAQAADRVIAQISRRTSGRRLLDVGCATGDFVEAAKRGGFEAEGLEPSSWASAIAKGRGLTVHQETLERFIESERPLYDVVLLIGVIEHFTRPLSQLQNIARLLRPGGIVVMWTGDVDSITSRVLGRRWWYWQGQHIQYFTRASLDLLCTRAGLSPFHHGTYPFGATFETLSNSLRRYPLHGLLTAAIRPLFLLRKSWPLYVPGELLLFARK